VTGQNPAYRLPGTRVCADRRRARRIKTDLDQIQAKLQAGLDGVPTGHYILQPVKTGGPMIATIWEPERLTLLALTSSNPEPVPGTHPRIASDTMRGFERRLTSRFWGWGSKLIIYVR